MLVFDRWLQYILNGIIKKNQSMHMLKHVLLVWHLLDIMDYCDETNEGELLLFIDPEKPLIIYNETVLTRNKSA